VTNYFEGDGIDRNSHPIELPAASVA
jgi:hypothetical protein